MNLHEDNELMVCGIIKFFKILFNQTYKGWGTCKDKHLAVDRWSL